MLRPVDPFLLTRFREIEQVAYKRLAFGSRGERWVALLLAREECLLEEEEARAGEDDVEEEVVAEDHGTR